MQEHEPQSDSNIVIDEDLVRAQVVNALNATAMHLANNVYPEGYRISYVRLRADGAVFLGTCQEFGTRLYDFRLLAQDGSKAHLYRLSPEGDTLTFEPCDRVVADVIGGFLGPTVHNLYVRLLPDLIKPTHPAPDGLQ
jgi:hypothetical protein